MRPGLRSAAWMIVAICDDSMAERRNFRDIPWRASRNATLDDMGYRGDDASRTWGDPRRQEPWPPSQGASASAAGPRHDGAQGYEPDSEYPPADEYGVYEQGPHGYSQHGAGQH